jgi:hypothetical protein
MDSHDEHPINSTDCDCTIILGEMRIGEAGRTNTVVSEPNGEHLDRNIIASLLAGNSITTRTYARH